MEREAKSAWKDTLSTRISSGRAMQSPERQIGVPAQMSTATVQPLFNEQQSPQASSLGFSGVLLRGRGSALCTVRWYDQVCTDRTVRSTDKFQSFRVTSLAWCLRNPRRRQRSHFVLHTSCGGLVGLRLLPRATLERPTSVLQLPMLVQALSQRSCKSPLCWRARHGTPQIPIGKAMLRVTEG